MAEEPEYVDPYKPTERRYFDERDKVGPGYRVTTPGTPTATNAQGEKWNGVPFVGRMSDNWFEERAALPEMDESQFRYGGGLAGYTAHDYADRFGRQAEGFYGQGVGAQSREHDLSRNAYRSGFDAARQHTGMYQQDRRDRSQVRGQMLDYAGRGPGPSQAQAQLQMGSENAMRQNLAMARSGRGIGGEASALRNAQWNNAFTQAQTNQQAGLLRAQEADAWRGRQLQAMGAVQSGDLQSQGAASNMYSRDLGFATSGMQGDLQQRGLNDQFTGAMTGYGLQSQQLGHNVLKSELDARTAYQTGQAQLSSNTNIANAQLDAQTDKDGGFLGMIGTVLSDESVKTEIQPMNNITGAQAASVVENDDSDIDVPTFAPPQVSTGGGGGGMDMGEMMGMAGTAMSLFSDARSKSEIQRLTAENNHLAKQLTALGGQRRDPDLYRVDNPWPGGNRTMSASDTQLSRQLDGVRSDALANIDSIGRTPAQEAIASAPGYAYKYKDPSKEGAAPGQHFGPMAQDLEKTPVGASVVEDDPRSGLKKVNTGRLSLVNTAAVSDQQRDLEKVEAEVTQLRKMLEATGSSSPEWNPRDYERVGRW